MCIRFTANLHASLWNVNRNRSPCSPSFLRECHFDILASLASRTKILCLNCPSEALICLMLALGFGWPSEHQSATNDNTNVYRSPNKQFLKIYIFRWQKQVDCLHMISKMASSVWKKKKERKPALRRCPLWRPLVTRKQLHDQNWNLKALTSDHRLACSDFLTQSSAEAPALTASLVN